MHRFLSILCLSLISIGTAQACSCSGPTPCGVFKHSDVLFLGKVTAIEEVDQQMKFGDQIGHQLAIVVHITSLENFAGDQRVGQDVLVSTGSGGSDCGYWFKIGETYLVDAYFSNGVLNTGICNLTGTATSRTIMLREFRTLAAGRRVPDLSGVVGIPVPEPFVFPLAVTPLASTPITITSDQGAQRKVLTDSDGVYTFPTLPPGKYSIEPILPSELTTRETEITKKPIRVEVPGVSGASSACHQDIFVLPSGSISGLVLDESGKPVPGSIYVRSIGDPQKSRLVSWGGSGDAQADGSFTLHFLAEGPYQIQFTPRADISQRWFYPGTLAEANAKTIVVQKGQQLRDVRFVLPAPSPTPSQ